MSWAYVIGIHLMIMNHIKPGMIYQKLDDTRPN